MIHGAATDVFETEPANPANPPLALDSVVVTPHIAAGASDNFANTIGQMFRNIAAAARGEPVPAADLVVGYGGGWLVRRSALVPVMMN